MSSGESKPPIMLLRSRIEPRELARIAKLYFGDMVKYVADISREVAAVGGELHADAEEVLLEDGSRQVDLWGANYYPGRGPDGCIEYTSLINIRPASGNPGMEIANQEISDKVRAITFNLIGTGEPLP